MHCTEHACDELVNSIALLDKWHQSSYSTLVVGATTEVREDQFLEGIDLVLKSHQVRDCFVAVGVSYNRTTRDPYSSHPSLGSLIDLRLIYSSYSKSPATVD